MREVDGQVTDPGRSAPRLLVAALAATLVACALHAATGLGGSSVHALFDGYLLIAVELVGLALFVTRARIERRHPVGWWLLTVAFACWIAGDVVWTVAPDGSDPLAADVLDALFYVLAGAGLAHLAAQGKERIAARMLVDGLLAALAVAAVVVAIAFPPIVEATRQDTMQAIFTLSLPIGDLVLLGFVLTGFAAQSWRPGRSWLLVAVGAVLATTGDLVVVYRDTVGSDHDEAIVRLLWAAALLCYACAAWQPWRATVRPLIYGRLTVVYPSVFATVSLALLVYDHFKRISHASVVLAALGLLVALLRTWITLRENRRLLMATREEALTDGLTGLPNRRSLMRDLERLFADGAREGVRPATFAFFDLDGFKGYNDTFGHAAGDMLLDRLGARLAAAVGRHGRAYRLGGDEFCVLLEGRVPADGSVMRACRAALEERGEGFSVGASCGAVTIPDEAADALQALHLADQRMYDEKAGTRASSRRQTRDVLLQVLREREPDLHSHLQGVAALAVAVGRELGLSAEQLDEVARAAELHDVGKIAVPDEILHKPGPLNEREWELMREHTLIGQRILAAAPAMRPVAALVRSSHERFDGAGYPDGLAGAQIPLGARIIAVCDAFNAMTSSRPYQQRLDTEAALAELRRCAGTQFDPAVVEAFATVAARGLPEPLPESDARVAG